ncbi:HpcH/HpaI aldolase family protein [Marinitenerispora sediminis]|uniref:HpcH/HpaI aldolase family protein n=1 Tax=Marinitenerispora sediminis TaxID=1931232 RepID=UPI000DF33812|nr:aldolase/citrate lyase family protein [Marinitenerispora sediminis]RCV48471.1 aldolase [Marinitenerispora sediminis]
MGATTAEDFTARLRRREQLVGYWVVCDNPVGTERIAGLGYDYVGIDVQHGLLDYAGALSALTAVDARGRAAGLVRVPAKDPAWVGRALDAGARGVIVPLVDSAEEAAAMVRATRYPPHGVRSYGPMRSALRVGPVPAEADDAVACVVMIETAAALEAVEEICATPGLDAVYVGPSDLALALGARWPGDPDVADALQDAMKRVAAAAAAAGIAAGAHSPDGATAVRRFEAGFTFATIASDLTHLEQSAAAPLAQVRPADA